MSLYSLKIMKKSPITFNIVILVAFTQKTEGPDPLHFKHSHCTSIGGKGGASPSLLHTTFEGPTVLDDSNMWR